MPEQNKSSAHYVHLLLAQAETLGFSAKAFLATANVSPDDVSALDKWVDNSVLTRIVKALWRLSNDEGMGFYERPVALGTGQVTFDYMLGGQNLAAIFERGQRLLSVLPPEELGFRFTHDETIATVTLNNRAHNEGSLFMQEFSLVIWHRFASWAIDEAIPLTKAFFHFEEPPHSWFYPLLFHTELEFAASATGFSFPVGYLSRRPVQSGDALKAFLVNAPADFMYLAESNPSIGSQLRAGLQHHLRQRNHCPKFEDVCKDCGLSRQRARRGLATEGLSYRELCHEARQERAVELLKEEALSIEKVSEMLGYSESSAFSRAFKQWFGVSPSIFKNQK